jgi:hypothetical protein
MKGQNRQLNANGEWLWWKGDQSGHGTPIAGIIAAISNNGYGVRGMGNIPLVITRGLDNEGNARINSSILCNRFTRILYL